MTEASAGRAPRLLFELVHDNRAGRLAGARRGRTLLCALGLFALVLGFFVTRLEASQAAIRVDNCVLGADARSYADGLARSNYFVFRLRKHPLAVMSVAAIAKPLSSAGLSTSTAASVALALIQALGAVAFFAFLRRQSLGDGVALALTLLLMTAFSSATVFSVVETYGVTIAAVAIALLIWGELARHATRFPARVALLAGLAGSLPGLANLPAASFVLAYAGLSWSRLAAAPPAKCLWLIGVPAIVALLLSTLPLVALDAAEGFAWQAKFLDSYASLEHFFDRRVLVDYLPSFFIFPWVAPLDHVQCRFTASDFAAVLRTPVRLALMVSAAVALLVPTARALARRQSRPLALSALAVAGSYFLFHLYLNPDEALLYSPQWVAAFILAASAGLREGRFAAGMLAITVGLCLLVNVDPLHSPRTASAATCCPSPAASELAAQSKRANPVRAPLAAVPSDGC